MLTHSVCRRVSNELIIYMLKIVSIASDILGKDLFNTTIGRRLSFLRGLLWGLVFIFWIFILI